MNDKVTLQNLIDSFAKENQISKEKAEVFVKEFFQLIKEGLKDDKLVKIKGLGTFKVIDIEPRESVNVNTGERFQIPGYQKLAFVPDTELKDAVNQPFADFETVLLNPNVSFDRMEKMEDVMDENPSEKEMEVEGEEKIKDTEDAEDVKEVEEAVPSFKEEAVLPVAESSEKTSDVPTDKPLEKSVEESLEVSSEKKEEEEKRQSDTSEEKQEEKPKAEMYRTLPTKRKSRKSSHRMKVLNILIGAILFVVLMICIVVAYWLVFPKKMPAHLNQSRSSQVVRQYDSAAILRQDSISRSISQNPKQTEPETSRDKQVSSSSQPSPKEGQKMQAASSQKTAVISQTTSKVPTKSNSITPKAKGIQIIGLKTTHVMKSGENFYTIAKKYLGSKDKAKYIIEYNHFKDPNLVRIGTPIRIPKLSE